MEQHLTQPNMSFCSSITLILKMCNLYKVLLSSFGKGRGLCFPKWLLAIEAVYQSLQESAKDTGVH